MGTLHKHVTVGALPAAVYNYIANVRNAPGYISAIHRITSGPVDPPAVGQRFAAEATFLGRPAALTLRLAALDPGRRVVIALDGDPAATLTIALTPAVPGPGTRVATTLDVPSVSGLVLPFVMGPMLDESMQRLARAVG
ncbi:MAG TPA: SRPBCC family protein [Chloroflexia bacterium]|nr:SRPBCC family protein [Chloroflexia bacterium]